MEFGGEEEDFPDFLNSPVTEDLLLLYKNKDSPISSCNRLLLITKIQQFLSSNESFFFELNNLNSIENEDLIGLLLGNLLQHMEERYSFIIEDPNFNEEAKKALYELVFISLSNNPIYTNNRALFITLNKVKCFIIAHLYKENPEEGRQLIDSICSNEKSLITFCIELSEFIADEKRLNGLKIDDLLSQMSIDGAEIQLLSLTISCIQESIEESVKAFSCLINWIDINILNEARTLELISMLINDEKTCVSAFECMEVFFHRANTEADIFSIITSLNLKFHMMKALDSDSSDEKTLQTVAELLNTMFQSCSNDISLDFIEVADQILVRSSLEECIKTKAKTIAFLSRLFNAHNERVSNEIIQIGIKMCNNVLEKLPFDSGARFFDGLSVIEIVLFDNIEPIYDIMNGIIGAGDIIRTEVVLEALSKKNSISFECLIAIATIFEPILGITDKSEVKKPQYIKSVLSYAKITMKALAENIELSKKCFYSIFFAFFNSGISDSMIYLDLSETTKALIEQNNEVIDVLNASGLMKDTIIGLINKKSKDLYNLALLILNLSQEANRETLIKEILSVFIAAANQNSENEYLWRLNFIGKANYSDLSQETKDLVIKFFVTTKHMALTTEETFTEFICSSSNALQGESLDLFMNDILQKVANKERVSKSIIYAITKSVTSNELTKEQIGIILQIVIPNLKFSCKYSKKESKFHEEKDFFTATSLFLINVFDEFINESDKQNVVKFVVCTLKYFIQPNEILIPILCFLLDHISIDFVVQELLIDKNESFKAILATDDLNYYFPDLLWREPFHLFATLHKEIYSINNDVLKFIELQLKGLPKRNIDQYISFIQTPSDNIDQQIDAFTENYYMFFLIDPEEEEEEL